MNGNKVSLRGSQTPPLPDRNPRSGIIDDRVVWIISSEMYPDDGNHLQNY